MSWQELFDQMFPQGLMLERSLGDPETDPVCYATRVTVVKEDPAPVVWLDMNPVPQAMVPSRMVSMNKIPSVRAWRVDLAGSLWIWSAELSDHDLAMIKSLPSVEIPL